MPPLAQTIGHAPANYEYLPALPSGPPLGVPVQPPEFPQAPNQFLRCPLPPIAITPDTLRQFYRAGEIPQVRVLTPATLSNSAAAGGTTTTTVAAASSGSSSSASTPVSPTSQQTALTTPPLNAGDQYTTTLTIAKAFEVLRVSVNAPVRVELYKTAAAQNQDLGRSATFGSVNNPPDGEIMSACICDLYLDTVDKFSWVPSWSITGSNADIPQSSSIYVTITNIDDATNTYTVTFVFVPLES